MTARVIDFDKARYSKLQAKPVDQLTIAEHIWMLDHMVKSMIERVQALPTPMGKVNEEVTFTID